MAAIYENNVRTHRVLDSEPSGRPELPMLRLSVGTTTQKPFLRAGLDENLSICLLFIFNLMLVIIALQKSLWVLAPLPLNFFIVRYYSRFVVRLEIYPSMIRITTPIDINEFRPEDIKEIKFFRWYNGMLTLTMKTSLRRMPFKYNFDPFRIIEVSPMELQKTLNQAFHEITKTPNP